jgi:hypothetical protein
MADTMEGGRSPKASIQPAKQRMNGPNSAYCQLGRRLARIRKSICGGKSVEAFAGDGAGRSLFWLLIYGFWQMFL